MTHTVSACTRLLSCMRLPRRICCHALIQCDPIAAGLHDIKDSLLQCMKRQDEGSSSEQEPLLGDGDPYGQPTADSAGHHQAATPPSSPPGGSLYNVVTFSARLLSHRQMHVRSHRGLTGRFRSACTLSTAAACMLVHNVQQTEVRHLDCCRQPAEHAVQQALHSSEADLP